MGTRGVAAAWGAAGTVERVAAALAATAEVVAAALLVAIVGVVTAATLVAAAEQVPAAASAAVTEVVAAVARAAAADVVAAAAGALGLRTIKGVSSSSSSSSLSTVITTRVMAGWPMSSSEDGMEGQLTSDSPPSPQAPASREVQAEEHAGFEWGSHPSAPTRCRAGRRR
ncbi:uncharacterized protein LOC106866383 [Brachypodium distachyon]|uniref:uncharacterized protein LOC106866383 n=1 Tax=Brachypodium distachyon TaxID=15368 RepID=UPI00071CEAD5|nr:uncharacterized protein LOC106866383 [Brachypodium distachyon]|eukprot:XP_014755975.1 uncharacterized protein LOC106866383 [Brachypodium distachyon]